MELLNIYDLSKTIRGNNSGILFCFGTSVVSKLIMAKTRLECGEVVPSHIALLYGDWIFESTTEEVHINNKIIKSGVRNWLVKDFIEAEKKKLTKYYFYKMNSGHFNVNQLTDCLHLPYGVDNIIDFVLKDKSNGDRTHGLICSQYANKVTGLSKQACPSPADLFRIVKDLEKE